VEHEGQAGRRLELHREQVRHADGALNLRHCSRIKSKWRDAIGMHK
jgi:hypothetical protein